MAWACANSIYKIDENSEYYTSSNDNQQNPHEGYTYMTFNTEIEKAMWIFGEYKYSLEIWAREMWKNHDVQITYIVFDLKVR